MFWILYTIALAITLVFSILLKLKLKSSTAQTLKFMGREVSAHDLNWILNVYILIAFIPYLNVIFMIWGIWGSKFEK